MVSSLYRFMMLLVFCGSCFVAVKMSFGMLRDIFSNMLSSLFHDMFNNIIISIRKCYILFKCFAFIPRL